ncbi:MAG TPA: DUF1189 domain-containing protein [Spirochaetes bacterium]|nr:DUF1189 domain-containing protein [Spirochaetota bacterium]
MESEERGIFGEIIDSIVNFRAYPHYARQKAGRVLLYLLVLTLIFGGISAVKPVRNLEREIKEMIVTFQEKSPEFIFKNGRMLFEGKKPITITEGERNIIVMDPTGKADSGAITRYEKGVVISREKVYYKKSGTETRIYNLSNLREYSFNKSDILSLLGKYRYFSAAFAVLYIIWYYIAKLFSAFLLAVLGLVIAGIVGVKTDFPGSYAMSIHALTLPIVLDTAVGFLPFTVPWFLLIYYLAAVVYLWMGLSAFKEAGLSA